MSERAFDKPTRLFVISLMLVSSIQFLTNALSPVLPLLSEAYPNAGPFVIQSILTIPPLLSVPVQLIVGGLSFRIRKKDLLIAGLLITFVAGMLPVFLNTAVALLVSAVLTGISLGILAPLGVGLVTDYYEGSARDRMFSVQSVGSYIGGIAYPLLAGALVVYGYQPVFLIYLISLPALLFVWKSVPKAVKFAEAVEGKISFKLPIPVIATGVYGFFGAVVLNVVPTNVGQLIVDSGFGDPSATGVIMSIMFVGSGVGAALFAMFCTRFRTTISEISILVFIAGNGIIFFSSSLTIVAIGAFIAGIGYSVFSVKNYSNLAEYGNTVAATYFLSIYLSFFSMGQALSSMIVIPLAKILGDGSARMAFGVSCVILVVSLALAIASKAGYKRFAVKR